MYPCICVCLPVYLCLRVSVCVCQGPRLSSGVSAPFYLWLRKDHRHPFPADTGVPPHVTTPPPPDLPPLPSGPLGTGRPLAPHTHTRSPHTRSEHPRVQAPRGLGSDRSAGNLPSHSPESRAAVTRGDRLHQSVRSGIVPTLSCERWGAARVGVGRQAPALSPVTFCLNVRGRHMSPPLFNRCWSGTLAEVT